MYLFGVGIIIKLAKGVSLEGKSNLVTRSLWLEKVSNLS